eukprot:7425609-Pyramimonas_sp.AAC.1
MTNSRCRGCTNPRSPNFLHRDPRCSTRGIFGPSRRSLGERRNNGPSRAARRAIAFAHQSV